MANVEQFEKAVTETGAEAMHIMRGPRGGERLVIQTPGGLITREVPLHGDLDKDIQAATISAREIVASAKSLTANPARALCASALSARETDFPLPNHMSVTSRSTRRLPPPSYFEPRAAAGPPPPDPPPAIDWRVGGPQTSTGCPAVPFPPPPPESVTRRLSSFRDMRPLQHP